jgi:hypothetical protein
MLTNGHIDLLDPPKAPECLVRSPLKNVLRSAKLVAEFSMFVA